MKKAERLEAFVESLTAALPATHDPCYTAYFLCFNRGDYYEAHDVLEHLWLKTRDPNHSFYKGLIQLAGGFVHLKLQYSAPDHPVHGRRLAPAARLFKLADSNLSGYGPLHMGLNLEAVSILANNLVSRLEATSFTTNPWDPANLPQLNPDALGKCSQAGNVAGSHE